MTDKKKLHQILSSLWKNDDSVGKMCYNQALQDVQTAIDLQEEHVRIKKGCKYRCLSDIQNTDTGAISFFKDKIYSAPEDNTLVSEENGWLCDTSENSSNFELVEEPASKSMLWHKFSDALPPIGVSVIAFHHSWVDEDFNPQGIRIGFLQDNFASDNSKYDFVSAHWWNCQDSYVTISKSDIEGNEEAYSDDIKDSIIPEYWTEIPSFDISESITKEHASEELEEAAERDVCEVVNCCSATGIPNDHIPSWVQDAMVNEFIHGAQWQKEQMMAKAIRCRVSVNVESNYHRLIYGCWDMDNALKNCNEGNKVKVIVIKED